MNNMTMNDAAANDIMISADHTAGGLPVKQPIGAEQVRKATETLFRYKDGKQNLDQRIVSNEQWWKMRHWDEIRTKNTNEPKPTSAWMFNSLANKHADAMDNYPEPNILPREAMDKAEAKKLSSIVPVIMEQNQFEQTYDDVWWYKLKHGCGVYSIMWNRDKFNGLGDIDIKKADILNLFWEPGITNIQDSPDFFNVAEIDNDTLRAMYPNLELNLSCNTFSKSRYIYDDTVDTSNRSAVVDWYYKRRLPNGQTVLHYCKYVNDTVLFATENEPDKYPGGLYNHGLYPFVFDVLFPEEGTPAGFGYIDICKDPQGYIDVLGQSILENAMIGSKPRFLVRENGNIKQEDFADLNKIFIPVGDNVDEQSIRQISYNALPSVYIQVLNSKIDELKETSGNRDISTGGSSNGVTAASAIAAMQEAGSKLSRDMIKASYRSFSKLVLIVIELIRQFYDESRSFRIMGITGAEEYINYSNAAIKAQATDVGFDRAAGVRLPVFDVKVNASKSSPYSKMAQNEMALQFYNLGFFLPQNAEQTLACLDMMDFDHKDQIIQKVQQNGTMYQSVQMLSQLLVQLTEETRPDILPKVQQIVASTGIQMPEISGNINVRQTEALGGEENPESTVTSNARKRVAESTSPV